MSNQTDEKTTRLLFYCGRHHLDSETLARVEELLHVDVDWRTLLHRAGQHNLLPLLYDRLRKFTPDPFPPTVKEQLRRAYYLTLLRNEWLQGNLQVIVEALRESRIEAIVLKGGALVEAVYHNLALRPMCDLDILIRQQDFDPAKQALERLGYRPSATLPPELYDFEWNHGGGMVFAALPKNDRRISIDLHWHIVTIEWYRHASAIDVTSLWDSARPLDLDGISTWQLAPEDTLLHLCLHPGIQHGFAFALTSLVDIDWLVGSHKLQWERVIERARAFKVKTATYWGLSLAQQLLGTAIPVPVLQVLRPSRRHLALTRRLLPPSILSPWGSTNVLRNRLLRFLMIDTIPDMIRMVLRTLFPRREWLAARYALGDRAPVYPYRLIHPLKVVKALVRAAVYNVQPLGIFRVRESQR